VAIPHGRLPNLTQIIAAIAIAPDGVDFDSIDHRPVRIFVAVLAPDRAPGDHLRVLARVSRLLRDPRVRARLASATSPAALLQVVREEEGPGA
jgi:PTS system nitrogen regulatory IIA component